MKGASHFVAEIMTNWLKTIRDPKTLDDFDKLIRERRAMLMIETETEKAASCMDGLRRCKNGDVLHLMQPLSVPKAHLNTDATVQKYREELMRYKCKFWQYQPRKKTLWVTVPWVTTRVHHGGNNFLLLKMSDIARLQPSRTERDIRLKQQQRRP